ncbi:MAG: DUF1501 domain-containing protein [Armatimonadetes bacterium]|nr:DUF1501 domain-containing protein [Armatimonadota bacterium]MDE2205374.1 DUF1501 domain-containing protein [Armatimonadota bacterium]
MELTRRACIKNGLTFVSLGMAAPSIVARAAAQAAAGGSNGRILVVLQMSGGNDGLNTVIPYTDPLYRRYRPTIGVNAADIVSISPKIGLHASLAALKPIYDQGRLAIVQGAGYPDPNRSHFRSMEIWQTADPTARVEADGWLGRWFDADGHLKSNPLIGVNFGGEVPKTLHSDFGSVVSMQNPQSYQLQTIAYPEKVPEIRAFTQLYEQGTMANSVVDLVRKIGLDAYTTSERVRKVLLAKPAPAEELGTPSGQALDAGSPANSTLVPAAMPNSLLARNLKAVAQLIGAGIGTRVYYVSTGGFDTHANQPPTQARVLKDVGDSLAAFYAELSRIGAQNDVVVMTFSEFGRRVQENASAGTDHGQAGPMFVMGGAVKGGLYGEYPSLADLDEGDLKYNVDFRQVYATLMDVWLKTPSASILNGSFNHLPFV